MCRREIPSGYLENPSLLHPLTSTAVSKSPNDSSEIEFTPQYQWFYEGRNGWWEYDERTTAELEEAYKASLKAAADAEENSSSSPSQGHPSNNCELLIAGFLYVIDFENMIQYRRNEPQRRRRVKRDIRDQITNRKGIAGIRISIPTAASQTSTNNSFQNTTSTPIVSTANTQQISHSNASSRDEEDGIAALSSRMGAIQLQVGVTVPSQRNNDLDDQQLQRQHQRNNDTLVRLSDFPPSASRIIQGPSEQNRSLGNVRVINQSMHSQLPLQPRDRQLTRTAVIRNGIEHDLQQASTIFSAQGNAPEDNAERHS